MNDPTPQMGHIVHRRQQDAIGIRFGGDIKTVLLTADDASGAIGVTLHSVPPGSGPRSHTHADHDECFFLLDGEVTFSGPDHALTARRGDLILVPRGTLHRFRNQSIRPATMLGIYTPGGPEGFFIEGGQPAAVPSAAQDLPPDDSTRRLAAKYDNILT